MKNNLTVESRESKVESRPDGSPLLFRPRPLGAATCLGEAMRRRKRSGDGSTLSQLRAFTLIELLTVIAIIGVIAALILPVAGAVKKHQYLYNTQAEMAQLETAIDRYKAAYGFYPPSPNTPPTVGNPSSYFNQLYYELVGTTNNSNSFYQTLDGSAKINVGDVSTAFPGIGGFMNCTKPNGGEDASAARNFLPDLKPKQFTSISNSVPNGVLVNILICSVGGPYVQYQPLLTQDINPWRYVCPGINNPGSYDLWIQLVFAPGQTNLICNWTKQVQINSPLP
jgi:prepilin-type N-terminal cleavage/methylation domain-containing protein